jgi:hypothetical protein
MEWSQTDWNCPVYGCRGVLCSEGPPEHGTLVRCVERADDPIKGRSCGRLMRWDAQRQLWEPVRFN